VRCGVVREFLAGKVMREMLGDGGDGCQAGSVGFWVRHARL
jgi:hypothetical protein